MTYEIKEENYFRSPHDTITLRTKDGVYKYLVLGTGLLPLHKNKSITDRDVVRAAKKIYFGDDVMHDRWNRLFKSAK